MSTATMMVMEPSSSVHAHDSLSNEKKHVVDVHSNVPSSSSSSSSSSPSTCTSPSIDASKGKQESSSVSLAITSPSTTQQGTNTLVSVPPLTLRPIQVDVRAIHLTQRRLEIQLAFLDRASTMIQEETHPDYQQRLQAATKERDRVLQQASQQLTYWETCTSLLHHYECTEAKREYEVNCEKLRQEMIEEIQMEMESLLEQRQGTFNSHKSKTTRKTRTRRPKTLSQETVLSDEEGFGDMEIKELRKKRIGNVFPLLEKRLASSEIEADVREVYGLMENSKKKRRITIQEQGPFLTKYYRSTLFYQDFIFKEEDLIFIQSINTTSSPSHEYIGMILSITSTELFVLSEKGTYHRLVFMDLRQGRIRISAVTTEQVAALNE